MEPRRLALYALLAFVVLTGASIVVSGSRSGADQGAEPWLLQVVGYLFALAAGVRLAAHGRDGERWTGFVVLGALVVLVLVDAVTWDDGGANIGLGLLRVVCLAVLAGAALQLVTRPRPVRR
ncbi:hypothetical protein [Blastococcus xanthinilyticus]|uniref:Uncharacterized protein n=1 Tax=Blastococcus xanthinilyticus TaxID=1564164 RepID=A0A5S5CXY7_9ACTN|nr:hypothetical protein [Blastococcus xanthinilyticus]TYP87954.1 hypothetical protein BD833_105129 [Blastococcus xanthinilyticus]